MKIDNLISKGYFPIELPPPFNSELLGKNAIKMLHFFVNNLNAHAKRDYRETIGLQYSAPKVGLSRRLFHIPNPIHQLELSEIICDNWTEIQNIYNKSKVSSSIQISDLSNERAVTTKDSFSEFKEKCLKISFNKMYELKIDISKYFPSIYTHSIPWAIHSKTYAKQNRRNDNLLGNQLDTSLRNAQSGQTIGIPIGPDTSRIIAEILGCTFDEMLCNEFKIKGFRFVDDCYFYFNSQSKAEKVFKKFQSILTDFNLDVNEEKTSIKKLPYEYESNWSTQLANFRIGKSEKSQRKDIKNFVSQSFGLANQFPNDSVLKFAIKKLFYSKIYKENWSITESLIYKMATAEPVILP